MNKQVIKLSIFVSNNQKNYIEKYASEINLFDEKYNYFYMNSTNNDVTIKMNKIFECYLDFFFNPENKINEKVQKSLLKALISIIKYEKHIILSPNTILKLLKYCLKAKLELKILKMQN